MQNLGMPGPRLRRHTVFFLGGNRRGFVGKLLPGFAEGFFLLNFIPCGLKSASGDVSILYWFLQQIQVVHVWFRCCGSTCR